MHAWMRCGQDIHSFLFPLPHYVALWLDGWNANTPGEAEDVCLFTGNSNLGFFYLV